MTVAELIEELKELNKPDAHVTFYFTEDQILISSYEVRVEYERGEAEITIDGAGVYQD